ncbi:MAG: C25 family cysteine peptidase [Bacteroidales bacterium]|nr:C25 family cysteine peptidase [Bacteroidales bacterium]
MKKVFVFLLCFAICKVYAQQFITYNFTAHQQVEYADGFSELLLENCNYIGEEGQPNLPVFDVSILLEPGHEIGSVLIKSIEYFPAIENINIRPASANFPISKGAPDGYKAVPNPDIYNLDKNYPEQIVGMGHTSFLRGHAIGTFLIYPVSYNPVQKKAELVKSITLEIHSNATPRAEESLKFLRNDQSTMERVQRAASNKSESILNSYNALCKRNDNPNYDILIITKADFVGTLNNDYVKHKNKWGFKVLIKTVEDINTSYTGIDNAEKMRNCVIDAYINDGISYLMLFGDSGSGTHNIIPYRKMYVNAGGTIDNLPSDVYFACLDGTWNSGDGTWGKPGFEDLEHEISVGRLCADNTNEINTFVTKLKKYQEAPVVADIKKALMVGENLDNTPTWGSDCKEQIRIGGSYNGYTTVGIPNNYTVNTLYDKNGYWNKNTLINHFKNGIHLVNHLGHSYVDFNMKLYNSDVTNGNFTNTGDSRSLAIVYSQGCYNGSFDNVNDWGGTTSSDCINEMFHKINGGVVANIGNSRYGWYNPGGTNGPSQRFDRYFFDGIFGKNIYTIGDANTYSKDINSALVKNNTHLRWCYYELTLMGDPSMYIWTDTPTTFSPKAVKNSDTEISVFTGVANARVAVLQNDVLLSRGVCNDEGEAILVFSAPFNPATVLLSVSGHNKYRFEQTGIVYTDAPPIKDLKTSVAITTVTLNWQAPTLNEHEPPTGYAIYRDGMKVATTPSLTHQDVAPMPNTTYEYCVKAVYAVYSSAPVCAPATTELYCGVVKQLKSSVKEKKITVYWNEPEVAPQKYTILRDGKFLKETTQSIFADDVSKENVEYQYCVIAHYIGCDSDPVCIIAKSGIVCGAIDKITSVVDILSITISWDHLSPNELIQYVVTRDGEVVQESVETSFNDTAAEEDTEYVYCITAEFDKCISDEKCITVKSGILVGIEQLKIENGELKIYPNPTDGELKIENGELKIENIDIYDIIGRMVANVETHGRASLHCGTIDISHLPAGVYFVRIRTENGVTVRKVIKN